jgi:surface polysaccharide O-acyltransferase-like enzyme
MEKIMYNNIKETPKIRFAYLDNVRSLVIILVIAMHAAVAYSGFGDWYYIEGSSEKLSILELIFFGFFQSFLQAWFMGILFFISAYLATKALAKRGVFNFIKERLFRLGLPLFIYVFIISPFIMFILLGYYSESSFWENYIRYILDFWWLGSTGPLWFVQVLMFFCIFYAIVKLLFIKPFKINNVNPVKIVFIIILTTIIAFLVRLVFPIGSSYLNLHFSYFPSYIVMFVAGVLLGENNLLANITDERNIKWLKLTFIIGIPLWAATMIFGGALEGKTYYNGGFYWQNLTFALWESFTAISFSMGIIALFRKNLNIENKFTRLIRDNAFGIYCFHAPILIAVSLALKQFVLKPILKFAIVFIFVSILCLFFSFLVRKIKPVGILFK